MGLWTQHSEEDGRALLLHSTEYTYGLRVGNKDGEMARHLLAKVRGRRLEAVRKPLMLTYFVFNFVIDCQTIIYKIRHSFIKS